MPGFTAPLGVDSQRQSGRIDLLERFQGQRTATAEAERDFERSQQQAFDALRSRQAWHAFSLQDKPLELTERYGDNPSGRSYLVDRRLIEAGVGLFRPAGRSRDGACWPKGWWLGRASSAARR
jgi:hypothetical protein